MNKVKKIKFLLFPLMFLLIVLFSSAVHNAAEEGGQVQTDAGIVLYPAETSTSDSSKPDDPSKTDEPRQKKPVGRLPSTGELIQMSFVISGAIVVLVFLLLLARKKNRGKGEQS